MDLQDLGNVLERICLVCPETLPKTEDELDLTYGIDYKDDIEIAQEKSINNRIETKQSTSTCKRKDR